MYWTKTYISAREVFYRGFREGKGIWGYGNCLTSQAAFTSGHLDRGEGEEDYGSAEEPAPVEALAAET